MCPLSRIMLLVIAILLPSNSLAETRLMTDRELAGISGQNGLFLSMLQNRLVFDMIDQSAEQLELLREQERRFIELELNLTHGAQVPADVAFNLSESLQNTTSLASVISVTDNAIQISSVGKIFIPFLSGGLFGVGGGAGFSPGLDSVTLQIPEEDEEQEE